MKAARPQISWHQLINSKWNYFASSNIVTGQNHILSRHFLDHMHCWVLRNVHGSQAKNLPGVNLTHTEETLPSSRTEGQTEHHSEAGILARTAMECLCCMWQQNLFHFLTTSCLKIQRRQQHPKAVPIADEPSKRVWLQPLAQGLLSDTFPDQNEEIHPTYSQKAHHTVQSFNKMPHQTHHNQSHIKEVQVAKPNAGVGGDLATQWQPRCSPSVPPSLPPPHSISHSEDIRTKPHSGLPDQVLFASRPQR